MPDAAIRAGDAKAVLAFWDAYGRITKDSVAGPTGSPMVVQPWQRYAIDRIYARDPATGRRRHRRAMVGTARKNGKTGFASILALYGLMCEADGAEVYSCAADRDQAKLVFGAARRIVEMDAELSASCRLYRDAIEYPAGGSVYRVLSSEAYTKEGLSPSMVVYDELHAAPDRALYDVMSLAMGARRDPLMVIVTTAGVRVDRWGQPTIAAQLYELGRRIARGEMDDPTYYMAWWEPRHDQASPDTVPSWEEANPSLGVVLDAADMRSALPPATPEAEFRTKRLNQWVASSKTWLPHGSWDRCRDQDRQVSKDEPIILGFDGSWTNDSTALVACTITDPHLWVVASWERPIDAASWVVPSHEVEQALLDACATYTVREIACDPYYWREQLSRWDEMGLPVVEWPSNSLARIVPACREFHTAVVERRLTHDGDPRLDRHIHNTTVKEDRHGARIVKKQQGAKIDLAVAAVIAYDRAHAHRPADVAVQFVPFD